MASICNFMSRQSVDHVLCSTSVSPHSILATPGDNSCNLTHHILSINRSFFCTTPVGENRNCSECPRVDKRRTAAVAHRVQGDLNAIIFNISVMHTHLLYLAVGELYQSACGLVFLIWHKIFWLGYFTRHLKEISVA
jgi:hypothetical protein